MVGINHLNFSKTAQHHNLNDTAVIEEFSKFIGDRQRLVYLFLLTIVDVAAVGPGTLTDWKLHLFVSCSMQLTISSEPVG